MQASDWLILATAATIAVVSVVAGVRGRKSFLGVWLAVDILSVNTLWLNRHAAPWGAVVFFGPPGALLAAGVALRVRSRHAGRTAIPSTRPPAS